MEMAAVKLFKIDDKIYWPKNGIVSLSFISANRAVPIRAWFRMKKIIYGTCGLEIANTYGFSPKGGGKAIAMPTVFFGGINCLPIDGSNFFIGSHLFISPIFIFNETKLDSIVAVSTGIRFSCKDLFSLGIGANVPVKNTKDNTGFLVTLSIGKDLLSILTKK